MTPPSLCGTLASRHAHFDSGQGPRQHTIIEMSQVTDAKHFARKAFPNRRQGKGRNAQGSLHAAGPRHDRRSEYCARDSI